MALGNLVLTFVLAHSLLLLVLSPIVFLCIHLLHRVSPFHPLHHVPGPLLPRLTSLWLVYHAWTGNECTVIHALHERYGPIVCTGPDSVHISSGAALHDIYSGTSTTKTSATGFLKPGFYSNFDIDGHPSIFSAIDPTHRARRAKAVAGIFSTNALKRGQNTIDACVKRFVERLKRERARALARTDVSRGQVDVLNVSRGLAIDTVTSYLFGEIYGGCEEDLAAPTEITGDDATEKPLQPTSTSPSAKLTASGMVNAFVAVGRFWYLPPWLFSLLDRALETVSPDPEASASIDHIASFVSSFVSKEPATIKASTPPPQQNLPDHHRTYQSRLLHNADLSPAETAAQCKDLIFAGTDSTAMNLATTLWHLSANPTTISTLRDELLAPDNHDAEPQSLPYLRAVVREGLRLGLANPSRLARLVPPTGDGHGWSFEGTRLPPGTVVGCSPYELHLNPDVFPEPTAFKPERWMRAEGEALDLMNRDHIPFGLGPRQCIARNLAMTELFCAVREVVKSGVLEGVRPVDDEIKILQWFNSKVIGEKIEVRWTE